MSKKLSEIQKLVDDLLLKIDNYKPNDAVMFSGGLKLSTKQFNRYWRPLVLKAIQKGLKIHVGCATGADEMVQQVCLDNNYFNVFVFQPVAPPAAESNATSTAEKKPEEPVVYLSEKFTLVEVVGKKVGDFKARDIAMRIGCVDCFGFYSQYACAGGTLANDLSVAANNGFFGPALVGFDFYKVIDFIRARAFPFDKETEQYVREAEEKFEV